MRRGAHYAQTTKLSWRDGLSVLWKGSSRSSTPVCRNSLVPFPELSMLRGCLDPWGSVK